MSNSKQIRTSKIQITRASLTIRSGEPTGEPLATSQTIAESSLPAEWTEVEFVFEESYPLEADTTYALQVRAENEGLYNKVDTAGGYSGGYYLTSNYDESYWNHHSGAWDISFEEYGVTGSGITYIYDGDGKRVEKIENGETTLFIIQYYEVTTANEEVINETSYYYLGGKLIAQRKGVDPSYDLSYIHQDSLSSTSVTSDGNGSLESSIKFLPFGSSYYSSGTLPTDKLFTGQRLDSTGLYYYGARYYDPEIGRFISPDTIVQSPANPQTLNRYSYALNNPLKFIDSTGNISEIMSIDVNYFDTYGFDTIMSALRATGQFAYQASTNITRIQ